MLAILRPPAARLLHAVLELAALVAGAAVLMLTLSPAASAASRSVVLSDPFPDTIGVTGHLTAHRTSAGTVTIADRSGISVRLRLCEGAASETGDVSALGARRFTREAAVQEAGQAILISQLPSASGKAAAVAPRVTSSSLGGNALVVQVGHMRVYAIVLDGGGCLLTPSGRHARPAIVPLLRRVAGWVGRARGNPSTAPRPTSDAQAEALVHNADRNLTTAPLGNFVLTITGCREVRPGCRPVTSTSSGGCDRPAGWATSHGAIGDFVGTPEADYRRAAGAKCWTKTKHSPDAAAPTQSTPIFSWQLAMNPAVVQADGSSFIRWRSFWYRGTYLIDQQERVLKWSLTTLHDSAGDQNTLAAAYDYPAAISHELPSPVCA